MWIVQKSDRCSRVETAGLPAVRNCVKGTRETLLVNLSNVKRFLMDHTGGQADQASAPPRYRLSDAKNFVHSATEEQMKAFMAAYQIYKHKETQDSLLFIPANHILMEQVAPHVDLETVVVRMLPVCTMRSADFMSTLRESL